MPNFNKPKKQSIFKDALDKKRSITDEDLTGNFKVSFQYLDTTQKYGSGFKDWQKAGLLSKAMKTLQGYCCSTLLSQVNTTKFTVYGNFPPKDKTGFEFPEHVPEDAKWARIHIVGKAVLAGHIVRDTFYVVFLDKSHKFFKTKRETGK